MICPNCNSDKAKKKYIAPDSDLVDVGKLVLAIFTACLSCFSENLEPNKRTGNKLVCPDCGYQEWL